MPTFERMGEIARGMFEVLEQNPGGLPLGELRSRVLELVPPNRQERENPNYYLGGWTTGLVKAEWIRKEDRLWFATPRGLAACEQYGDDPGRFAREWARLYHAAMRNRSGARHASAEVPSVGRRRDGYRPHVDRAQRLASAAAMARFAASADDLYDAHRRQVLSLAVWFTTEADGKYRVRYRSYGARSLPKDRYRELRHEHVITRKRLTAAMLAEPDRIAEILAGAIACVVTEEEHARLTALPASLAGWDRYIAADVDVYDEQTGMPFIEAGRFVTAT